jgi:hypothetical protein
MRVVDPGHLYLLKSLDSDAECLIRFVKRSGPKYPGNSTAFSGPTIQEYIRAIIDRLRYVDRQDPSDHNTAVIELLRESLYLLEVRAAERHDMDLPDGIMDDIELQTTCPRCGHLVCPHMTDDIPTQG